MFGPSKIGSMSAWVAKQGIRRSGSKDEPDPEAKPSTSQQWVETSSVRGRANLWVQKTSEPKEKEDAINPFAHKQKEGKWDGTAYYMSLGDHTDQYGRPVAGSKTEVRGVQAGQHISNEVIQLCEIIYEYGYDMSDGTKGILFGTLFQLYTKISNKVVGMLLRARKHGLVEFKGEMLYQRRDEDVLIRLVEIPAAMEEFVAVIDEQKDS